MQEDSPPGDVAALFARLTEQSLPGRRGERAWRALLQAHATLMRQLDTDLFADSGLRLADFDVLAQLAEAGGELRMTELAARTLVSRSGLTRRVARLVDEGLVRRGCRIEWCRSRTRYRNRAGPSSRCVEVVRRTTRRTGTRCSRDRSEESHRRLHVRLKCPKRPPQTRARQALDGRRTRR
jgi:predicted transcriptional regulator